MNRPSLKLVNGELLQLQANGELSRIELIKRKYENKSHAELVLEWMGPECYTRGLPLLDLSGDTTECMQILFPLYCREALLYDQRELLDPDGNPANEEEMLIDDEEAVLQRWQSRFLAQIQHLSIQEVADLNYFQLERICSRIHNSRELVDGLYRALGLLQKQLAFTAKPTEELRKTLIAELAS